MNVRDKINLCSTKSLSGFFVSSVDTAYFYQRRPEFEKLLQKYTRGTEFEDSFAMPYYNKETHGIDWFINPVDGQPVPLSSLAGTPEAEIYRAQREKTIRFFREKAAKMHPSERAYVDSMLKYVDVDYMDDVTFCFKGRVIIGVWGMTPRAGYTPATQITTNVKANELLDVTFSVEGYGEMVSTRPAIKCRAGYRLTAANGDIPQITPAPGNKFVRWSPFDPNGHVVEQSIHFTAVCEREELPPEQPAPVVPEAPQAPEPPAAPRMCKVQFNADQFGQIPMGSESLEVPEGTFLNQNQVPTPVPTIGYRFVGWNMDPFLPINNDVVFTAIYERDMKQVHFNVAPNGQIAPGVDIVEVPAGTVVPPHLIPLVTPAKGWVFKGWNYDFSQPVTDHIEVTAIYEKKKGSGCLKALLIALLVLLGILSVLLLLKFILGWPSALASNGATPGYYADVPGYADGGRIDDIFSTPINDHDLGDGITPGNGDNDYHSGVLPSDPGDIIDNPDGRGRIVDGVVNLFFEDDNADLNSFARDFRELYADTRNYQLDYDDYVKRVSIKFPPAERTEFERKINSEFGERYAFIMVDEYVLENQGIQVAPQSQPDDVDWFVDAVHARQAWSVTRGSENVVVAVVDDGCDVNHSAFTGRITKPYNVWTKSSTLGTGEGHGTHVAGLAVGTTTSSGVSGIAPECKLMPVQVFPDGAGYSTLSAEVSGVAYAIHQGAQVVNVSMGANMEAYHDMSAAEQERVSESEFKGVEKVWDRIYQMARKKNVVIVFAAGNSDVLTCLSPENRPSLSISVTAFDEDFHKTSFSNYGKGSTVAAPGEGIVSSVPGNRYTAFDGTSMAAPIVSGVVALMKSEKSDLTVAQTKRILMETGRRNNQHIGPMVQADKAVERVQSL